MSVGYVVTIQNGAKSVDLGMQVAGSLSAWMSRLPYFQVFGTIIKFVSVDMMNMFAAIKRTAKFFGCDKSMFKNSRRWTVLLSHRDSECLVFLRETGDHQRIVTFLANRPSIFSLPAWMRNGRRKQFSGTAIAESVKRLFIADLTLNTKPKNVPGLFAMSARNSEGHVALYNSEVIPVYRASINKLDELGYDWRNVWLSSHVYLLSLLGLDYILKLQTEGG